MRSRFTLCCSPLVMCFAAMAAQAESSGKSRPADALAVFNRRIVPILQSKNPSTCTQCHLAGVDLKNFIDKDQAKTFASLRKSGLIDVDQPDRSKLLEFIARKPEKSNALTDKARQQELDAFRAWIRAAVKDPGLLKAVAGKDLLGTSLPPEVIRHARQDRVLSSFVDNVWSQMGRCISCHSPEKNSRLVKKFGEQVSWIVPHDPAKTLKELVDGGNIDLEHPDRSPLLLKPAGKMKHGGGPKFLVGGPAWHGFLRFCNDYAATVNGKYKTKQDLPTAPKEVILLSQQFLRIMGMPEHLQRVPARVDLFRWDRAKRAWSNERWATSFSPVAGKRRFWQGMVSVTAPVGSDREKTIRKEPVLPPGAYLAKLYIDRDRKTEKNPNYELGEAEFAGQVEVTGRWQLGFRTPKIVRMEKLRLPGTNEE